MTRKEKKKGELVKGLARKYKLMVYSEDTMEGRFALKLSRLMIFILSGLTALFVLFLAILVIAYTPLREYIPGYTSSKLKKQALILTYKTDSLESVIEQNERYYSSIQGILMGDTLAEQPGHALEFGENTLDLDETEEPDEVPEDTKLYPSKMDSILRREVENNERYNIFNPFTDRSVVDLYPPVKGTVSQHFDVEKHHYGIDVSLEENSPVKATAEGIVVFAEWTVETGFVIIIKHDFDMLSVYKHNLALLKKQGEFVKKGEVIALTGNTGEYTTGPHLHFELWEDAHALNPEDFFDFD